jgi:sugar-specific transcriptional regulator TrmB
MFSPPSDYYSNVSRMTDFLDEKRKEIQSRLKELKPLVDEYQRLEAAERALAGVESKPARTGATTSRRNSRSASNGRRGRPKGSGTRSLQALELVRARPGITIPELADAMSIKQNYLYRVMPRLAEEGQVVKSGRGWHARDKS